MFETEIYTTSCNLRGGKLYLMCLSQTTSRPGRKQRNITQHSSLHDAAEWARSTTKKYAMGAGMLSGLMHASEPEICAQTLCR